MNIKKFIADNPQQALMMVKKEMGPDAVILETRTITPSGGHSGKGRSKIEVTAAIDYEMAQGKGGPEARQSNLEDQVKWEEVEVRLREIWDSLVMLQSRIMGTSGTSQELVYHNYFGLSPGVIKRLVPTPDEHLDPKAESRVVKDCLITVLKQIHTSAGNGRIFSFVGPTGVGKTTTMAKLAALSAVTHGRKTALITVDTFRIGAVDQLKTYARIMGLPLSVASNSVELHRAIRNYDDFDSIFIDTAGRSPGNNEDFNQLLTTLDTGDPIHHYLVLSATTRLQDLYMAERRFSALPLGSYIFTKLDETTDISDMLNFLLSRRRPISYFTTGQRVPEDIERATRRRVAQWMLRRKRRTEFRVSSGASEHGSSQSAQTYS